MGKMNCKLVSLDGKSAFLLFKREGGGQFHTWFSSPSKTIRGTHKKYLENRFNFNEPLTDEQFDFIATEYEKQWQAIFGSDKQEYQSREFCRKLPCLHQFEFDNGDLSKEELKSYCEECRAYYFHDWLQENGYKLIKEC
jgi:hypothetical protein